MRPETQQFNKKNSQEVIPLIDKIVNSGRSLFLNYINNEFLNTLPQNWQNFENIITINDNDTESPAKLNLQHFYNFLCKLKDFKDKTLLIAIVAETGHAIAEKLHLPNFGVLNFIGLKNIISNILPDVSAFNISLYFEIEELSKIITLIEESINQFLHTFHTQMTISHLYAENKTTSLLSRLTKRTPQEINMLKHLLKDKTRETLTIALQNQGISLVKDSIEQLSEIEKKYFLKSGMLTKKFLEILDELEALAITPQVNLPRRTLTFMRWFYPLPGDLARDITKKIVALNKEITHTPENIEERDIIQAKIKVLHGAKQSLIENDITHLNKAINDNHCSQWCKKRSFFQSETFRLVQSAQTTLLQAYPHTFESKINDEDLETNTVSSEESFYNT